MTSWPTSLPALAHLTIKGGIFAPIRKAGERVEWLDTQRGWQTESLGEFTHKWDGVTLLTAPDANSGEADYTAQRQKQIVENLRIPFVVGVLLLCLGTLFYQTLQPYNFNTHWYFYGLLCTKTLGTIISAMLVWYGIDSDSTFLNAVCKLNDRTNCNNVLNTPAAQLTPWLSWSEVGLFYFAGGLLYLIPTLLLFRGEGLILLWGLGCLALPYTFWSVWYQWRVARQWCVLCLAVQVLLWVEFYLFYLTARRTVPAPLLQTGEGWNLALFGAGPPMRLGAFVVIPALWALLKPYLQKALPYEPLFREFQKLKFDPDYLQGLLNKQRTLPPIFEGMTVIEMGNAEAENTIILVSNPTCAACRRNHLAVEKLLKTNDSIKCQVILVANPQDEAGRVALQVLSLPAYSMADALQIWFETDGQQFKHWHKQQKGNFEDPAALQQLALHLRWAELAGITTAPQTFLNGVEIPKFYSPAELLKLTAAFSNGGFANQQ